MPSALHQGAGSSDEKPIAPTFSSLIYYSDVETSDGEEDRHFVPPPITPELLATVLKQVVKPPSKMFLTPGDVSYPSMNDAMPTCTAGRVLFL